MVLTDADLLKGRDPVLACQQAVRGGATAIQVRDKRAAPRDLVALTRALVGAVGVPVVVNDRADVALAAGAAGAHLGQDDPPAAALRPVLPQGFLLGLSVGTAAEASRSREAPVDYWSVGPCFPTATKADAGPPLGIEGLVALLGRAPPGLPVIAIGGITALRAGAVRRAGAVGMAVTAAVWDGPDPEAAARALRLAAA